MLGPTEHSFEGCQVLFMALEQGFLGDEAGVLKGLQGVLCRQGECPFCTLGY